MGGVVTNDFVCEAMCSECNVEGETTSVQSVNQDMRWTTSANSCQFIQISISSVKRERKIKYPTRHHPSLSTGHPFLSAPPPSTSFPLLTRVHLRGVHPIELRRKLVTYRTCPDVLSMGMMMGGTNCLHTILIPINARRSLIWSKS